jgi:hypothetical protein
MRLGASIDQRHWTEGRAVPENIAQRSLQWRSGAVAPWKWFLQGLNEKRI